MRTSHQKLGRPIDHSSITAPPLPFTPLPTEQNRARATHPSHLAIIPAQMLAHEHGTTAHFFVHHSCDIQVNIDVERCRALRIAFIIVHEWVQAYSAFAMQIGVDVLADAGVEEWTVVLTCVEEMDECSAQATEVVFCGALSRWLVLMI